MKEKPAWLIEYEDKLEDGRIVTYNYDREGDILEIFFRKGGGCGVELADGIVLRYDVETGEPLSLIFLCFSTMMQPTELGPMSFPLTGLDDLPPEMRETVQRIITSPPVSHFLKVSALWRAPDQRLEPITYVEEIPRLVSLLRKAA